MLPGQPWHVHDSDRPHPRVITPPATPGAPPSDAIILFDSHDLSKWVQRGRGVDHGKLVAPKWKVENGYFEVAPHTGDLMTRDRARARARQQPKIRRPEATRPPILPSLFNGVVVQNHKALDGPAAYRAVEAYQPHGDSPILLQDHGYPVRFRNIGSAGSANTTSRKCSSSLRNGQ